MAKNFSLSAVVPEADTFTDRNGTQHDVLAGRTFGTLEFARLNKFQRDIAKLDTRMSETDDETEMEAIAKEQETIVNRFVKMVVPSLSEEQFHFIQLFEKIQFMTWWAEQQVSATSDEGKSKPGA